MIGKLAHALEQLQPLRQQTGSGFIATLVLILAGRIPARQCRQQGKVRLSTASQGRRLGRLQNLAGELKGLVWGVGFPQQHQTSDLPAGRHFQPRGLFRMITTQFEQGALVVLPSRRIAQEIGRKPQQFSPLHEDLMGETLIGTAIETQLQRPQHRLGFS